MHGFCYFALLFFGNFASILTFLEFHRGRSQVNNPKGKKMDAMFIFFPFFCAEKNGQVGVT
ncbi:hypothetical protein DQG23_05275 [Paenibacillus contaminans]|uniref:Uncharacterized protein n=1 Tax=Paenibacillus contaminans TaxID=450362 RepID=A0A329MX45_9BACL|nr:hypothetical protein DQG23_05275 [Paenibacillus contaminans]